MNFFRTFLFIISSSLITSFTLKPMEKKNQIKIWVLPYTFEGSKTLVLGMLESTWIPFVSTVPIEKIKDEKFHKKIDHAIAKTILKKKANIPVETMTCIFSEIILQNFKTEAATIAHQKTFGSFAQQEKSSQNISDSDGIKYFLNAINLEEDNFYINQAYSFAIFFINVPYVTCLSLQENREKFLGAQKASEKDSSTKNLFLWTEINEITNYCDDSDFINLLKTPEIKHIISKLNQKAAEDDEVITKLIEFLDDEK